MSAELEDYFRLMTANGAVQAYRAGWRHGLFQALGGEERTTGDLARLLERDLRALGLFLEALSALGLVERGATGWRAGRVLRALQGPYRELGDEYWAHLDDFLKTGRPMRRMNAGPEREAAYREQAGALAWMMAPAAALAAEWLLPDLPDAPRILDLGAGSGVWSLTLAARAGAGAVTLVDGPAVLDVAREFSTKMGLAPRLVPGDYHDVDLEANAYDLVFLGNVCHLESEDRVRSLLGRASRWLRPGGRVAIADVHPGTAPVAASLYALGLALRTERTEVHASADLLRWLAEAGFQEAAFQALEVVPETMGLWTGKKRPESAGEANPGKGFKKRENFLNGLPISRSKVNDVNKKRANRIKTRLAAS
jgi:ubiquinone/menaquinone biosynthesis C-methylase UbiE